jgi:hypothetical protein
VKNRTHYEEVGNILWDEEITISGSYYENSQFYYTHNKNFVFDVNEKYDITFCGETITGVVPTSSNSIKFNLYNGATIHIEQNSMYSNPNDGLERPFTTNIKLSNGSNIVTLPDKFLSENIARKNEVAIVHYGTCDSVAENMNKVVNLSDKYFNLKEKVELHVYFSNTNTNSSMTLGINGQNELRPVYFNGSDVIPAHLWTDNSIVVFVLINDVWNIVSVSPYAPTSMQSDWSQNDETAADYVKNRTHYDGSVAIVENAELKYRWSEMADAYYYPVCNTIFDINKQYRIIFDELKETIVYPESAEKLSFEIDRWRGSITSNEVYIYGGSGFRTLSIYEIGEIKTLDEKYIPDSIARIDDIVPSDWN